MWKGEQRHSRLSVTTCKMAAACFSSAVCQRRGSPVFVCLCAGGWWMDGQCSASSKQPFKEPSQKVQPLAHQERDALQLPQSCFVESICAGDGVILHRLAWVSWHADVSQVAVLRDVLEQRAVWSDVVRMEKETEKVGSGDLMGCFHPTAAGFRSDCSLSSFLSVSTCTNTNKSSLQWLVYSFTRSWTCCVLLWFQWVVH